MKTRRAVLIKPICLALLIFMHAVPVSASEGNTSDYMAEIGTKFGRGLVNILSSPAEIPCKTSAAVKEGGGWHAFPGLGTGLMFMLHRILVGVTEVGTFMIPMEATIPAVCQEPQAAQIS